MKPYQLQQSFTLIFFSKKCVQKLPDIVVAAAVFSTGHLFSQMETFCQVLLFAAVCTCLSLSLILSPVLWLGATL